MTTPLRAPVLVRAQLADVGLEQHRVEQLLDAVAGLGGNGHHLDRSAPIHRLESLLDELLLDAIGLRVGLVHLVDRDDDRDAGRFDVRDRFLASAA